MKRFLCATVLLLSVLRPTQAQNLLTYQEVSLSGGAWRYDYTVTNTQASTDLFDLKFTIPVAPAGTSVPVGWDFIAFGGSVETFSTNVGERPFGTDVRPGGSLSGFSFQFGQRLAQPVPFTATFSNSLVLTGTAVNAATGSAAEPIPLFGPAALLLLGIGIAGIAFSQRRRFR
jgi:hypothetical protein